MNILINKGINMRYTLFTKEEISSLVEKEIEVEYERQTTKDVYHFYNPKNKRKIVVSKETIIFPNEEPFFLMTFKTGKSHCGTRTISYKPCVITTIYKFLGLT